MNALCDNTLLCVQDKISIMDIMIKDEEIFTNVLDPDNVIKIQLSTNFHASSPLISGIYLIFLKL